MLPAAKVLLVTVLVGGGTVGTYALAGGKFGTGGSGNGNAETTQVSTPETTTPTTDGQSRVGDTAPATADLPAASREGNTVEERAQDEGPSVTLAGADGGKDASSADASPSSRVEPEKTLEAASQTPTANSPEGVLEVREETISAAGRQQKESQEETALAGNSQEQPGIETSVIGGSDTSGEKASLGGGSNEPGAVKDVDADSQAGQQNVESSNEENLRRNNPSQDNQGAVDSSESNTSQDRQPAVSPTPNKEGTDVADQVGKGGDASVSANTEKSVQS